jgi:hypothetical protein
MGSVDEVDEWVDEKSCPSLGAEANTIKQRKAEEVIRVLRNALAHGNVIYLDKDNREIAGNRMVYMAFLSRYEEHTQAHQSTTTYRVVVTSADEFLRFVKAWANWVNSFPLDRAVSEAA